MKKIISMVLICTLMICCFAGCGAHSYNLADFISVTFDGVDGEGRAIPHLDAEGLLVALQADAPEDNHETGIGIGTRLYLIDSITLNLDKKENLKNGDKVTMTVLYDQGSAKNNDIKFNVPSKLEFEVSGLKDKIEVDAFNPEFFNVKEGKGIYIDFVGVSPEAEIEIRNTLPNDNPLSKATYYVEDGVRYLTKGDTAKIYVRLGNEQSGPEYYLKEEYATVTCDNVSEYVSSFDQLDTETQNKLKQQCNDLIESKLKSAHPASLISVDNSYHYTPMEVSNIKFNDAYVLNIKEGYDGYVLGNKIVIGYTLDAKFNTSFWGEEIVEMKNLYGGFILENVVREADGTFDFNVSRMDMTYIFKNKDVFNSEIISPEKDSHTVTETPISW